MLWGHRPAMEKDTPSSAAHLHAHEKTHKSDPSPFEILFEARLFSEVCLHIATHPQPLNLLTTSKQVIGLLFKGAPTETLATLDRTILDRVLSSTLSWEGHGKEPHGYRPVIVRRFLNSATAPYQLDTNPERAPEGEVKPPAPTHSQPVKLHCPA